MKRVLFEYSYWLITLAPFILIVQLIFFNRDVSRELWFVLFILIAMPPTFYLCSRRCTQCKEVIYSTKTVQQFDLAWKYPLPRYMRCPYCDAPAPWAKQEGKNQAEDA